MKPLTDTEVKQLFVEISAHPALLNELSEYQLSKLLAEAQRRATIKARTVIQTLSDVSPEYKYPEGQDETKLFEYWDDRLGNPVKQTRALQTRIYEAYLRLTTEAGRGEEETAKDSQVDNTDNRGNPDWIDKRKPIQFWQSVADRANELITAEPDIYDSEKFLGNNLKYKLADEDEFDCGATTVHDNLRKHFEKINRLYKRKID